MTEGAQQALRRVMELHSDTTRFALACNFSNKIIEPVQSRCAVLRYTQLSEKDMLKRLIDICKREGLDYVPEGLEAIIFTSNGDLRHAINSLQSTASSFKVINSENVFKFCDRPHSDIIRMIIKHCIERDIDNATKLLCDLYRSGYSPIDIITVMFKVTKTYNMNDSDKLEFIKVCNNICLVKNDTLAPIPINLLIIHIPTIKQIGYAHMEMISGTQSLIQLSGLIANLCSVSE